MLNAIKRTFKNRKLICALKGLEPKTLKKLFTTCERMNQLILIMIGLNILLQSMN